MDNRQGRNSKTAVARHVGKRFINVGIATCKLCKQQHDTLGERRGEINTEENAKFLQRSGQATCITKHPLVGYITNIWTKPVNLWLICPKCNTLQNILTCVRIVRTNQKNNINSSSRNTIIKIIIITTAAGLLNMQTDLLGQMFTQWDNFCKDLLSSAVLAFLGQICNRTPGSRQPSPAEESLPRPPTLLDPTQHGVFPPHHPFNHMLGGGGGGGSSGMDHTGSVPGSNGPGAPGNQMNSGFPHQMPQMNQLQPPVMNGVGGMQMAQSPMLNHQSQGPNQIESPGNLLQQQPPNFDVQLFNNPCILSCSCNVVSPNKHFFYHFCDVLARLGASNRTVI
uniref:Uncharacterized protein n=1 Tax=Glossina austeni TaxID=7395 RepID=A0A1A9VN97_GLOAU